MTSPAGLTMRRCTLPHWLWRKIVLAASFVVLAWLVVTHSLAAYIAGLAPQVALWLNPGEPEALVKVAEQSISRFANAARPLVGAMIRSAETRSRASNNETADVRRSSQELEIAKRNSGIDLPKIREWLALAVANDPLNAGAMSILGEISAINGEDGTASAYMKAAARLSLHQSIAVYWLMRQSSQTGNYEKAIYYADALLRTDPGTISYVEPYLARLAEQRSSSGFVKSILKTNPPWRGVFLKVLPGYISDARTPLDLLLALRTSPNPPDSVEINDYLQFLVAHRFYELAHYTWLQFLPRAMLRNAGLLFNGSFEITPSGSPFDWLIAEGSGVTIDIVPTPDKIDGRALLIDFLFGRVDYHSVRELVILAPGIYQFTGQYKGKLVGPRGLKWRVVCADNAGTPIGESPMISGTGSTRQEVKFTFTVPPTQCPAQYVRLDLDSRMASEEIVSGSIIFENLQITRASSLPVIESTE